jgi:hypothetical protein
MTVVEEASSSGGEEGGSGAWTREQEKAFENAVATTAAEDADGGDARWEKIAAAVEGKTAGEVRRHYELLVEDVEGIDSGRVPLPTYSADCGAAEEGGGGGGGKKGSGGGGGGGHGEKGSAKSAEQERRKGIAWTEDEHRLTFVTFRFRWLQKIIAAMVRVVSRLVTELLVFFPNQVGESG